MSEQPPQQQPPGPAPQQGPAQPAFPPPAPAAPMTVAQERTMSMLCHLLAFAGMFIPLGNVLGPLVLWLMKRQESAVVDAHGKESVNFQISMTIYTVVSAVLTILLVGFVMLLALMVFWLVVVVIASIRANEGGFYRYPLCIRFIT